MLFIIYFRFLYLINISIHIFFSKIKLCFFKNLKFTGLKIEFYTMIKPNSHKKCQKNYKNEYMNENKKQIIANDKQ